MRSESEIFALILGVAREDERVRAVLLNGSRADPSAPRDFFQDYDVVYLVSNVASFIADPHWIDRFGERMILQLPDWMGDPPGGNWPGFTYLMQFMDGNRIDLSLFPMDRLSDLQADSLTRVLLDKDGVFQDVGPSNEKDYLPRPPTARAFADCCNEFWWVSPYVAKGLWRNEFLYARYHMDENVRPMLMKMLVWRIGVKTGFAVNPGKFGKYFQRYLDAEEWSLLMKTFADADPENNWEALLAMGRLFRAAAHIVAEHFGYEYPALDDERVSGHLLHVRGLPRNAREMY